MANLLSSLDRGFIASLSHGLAVLEAVAESGRDISLAELAERVHFNKTSTWRLAHTLVELGYLQQDPQTRNFRPAARVLALGYVYFDGLDLKQHAQYHLRELFERHNETVSLSVRSGDELIYIDRIATSHIVNVNLHVGSRLPLYCTSMGRALISEMPPAWIERYVKRAAGAPRLQTQAPVEYRKLVQNLAEVRDRGYAMNDEELVKGLRAVSSPIRDRNSEIIAAVSITVPSSRVNVTELHRTFAPDLIDAASNISSALGYRPQKFTTEPTRRRVSSNGRKSRRTAATSR